MRKQNEGYWSWSSGETKEIYVDYQAGVLKDPIVALGIQVELKTPGVLFDDFRLETNEKIQDRLPD